MDKIMEVFFTDEVEEKVGYTNQHIRRLIKEGKADLIKNEDYRIGNKGQYLFTDTAIEKLLEYKGSSTRNKNKETVCSNK